MKPEDQHSIFVEPPAKLPFVAVAIAAAFYFVCDALAHEEEGIIGGFSICVLIGIGAMCRPLWGARWFWFLYLVIFALHALTIFLIRWPEINIPVILLSPFAVVDFLITLGLVKLIHSFKRSSRY